MLAFTVFTLVVAPGTGDCTGVTDPVCPERPESGSCVAILLCEELAGGPSWAKAEPASANAVTTIENIRVTVQILNCAGMFIKI